MLTRIDWEGLSARLETRRGEGEEGASRQAREALAAILGEEALEASVEHVLASGPGSELAHAVLVMVRPLPAMRHCYRIYRSDPSGERRRGAVRLLREFGDARAVGWIAEFLVDPDDTIQVLGASLLDHLLWNFLVEPDEVESELRAVREHELRSVRERSTVIEGYLAERRHE